MTPKEKAKNICLKYERLLYINISEKLEDVDFISKESKQCTLIAVDEIIEIAIGSYDLDMENWWKEVKQEINNL